MLFRESLGWIFVVDVEVNVRNGLRMDCGWIEDWVRMGCEVIPEGLPRDSPGFVGLDLQQILLKRDGWRMAYG